MRKLSWLLGGLLLFQSLKAQETFPINGVADQRQNCYAFTNAKIVTNAQTVLSNATLLIRDGKIVAVGQSVAIPKEAVVVNCNNKYIYPSFIDAYTDYGIATPQRSIQGFDPFRPAQLNTNTKGAYGWNQAVKPEVEAAKLFVADDAKAKALRDAGFGVVSTHVKDGIVRGTGAVVSLGSGKENKLILKEKATANFSFNKGASTQSYPSSVMGSIALLRQTYLDAQWYKNKPESEGVNLSLAAFNQNMPLVQVFESDDKWTDLRADRLGDEFGVQYVIKGAGNEYQRLKEIAATKATFILPLNFPLAIDVEDPNDARAVSLADMKHWELAPTNPAVFEKNNIPFCLTTADDRDSKTFMANLRKAIDAGLSEAKAMEALTIQPAKLLGVADITGTLEVGKLANFIITNGPVFNEKTQILQNWVQGEKYAVKEEGWNDVNGTYVLNMLNDGANENGYQLSVKSNNAGSVINNTDTLTTQFSFDGKMVKIQFSLDKKADKPSPNRRPNAADAVKYHFRLYGVQNGDSWNGYGEDSVGNKITWTAKLQQAVAAKTDSVATKKTTYQAKAPITYPFAGYGVTEMPKAETVLFKNATVWTSEKEGVLKETDVLIKAGKIVKVGKNITDASAKIIDATGKHLTAGIIDEHSHIAAASINEGAQSVTSEVRIADNLNPEDINIYRQLSGGVTSSHILHGSANTIGGQTQLIKLRWGANDEELMFKGADPFIKFALGENVKRTTSPINNRFPDTRMGVEQVLDDAFARAKAYEFNRKTNPTGTRKDMELEALVEIMNKKRFITCHSYVQSEIVAAMRIGEKYGFPFNTFTHILEGYKVADKMKQHGAHASTFSDWYYYKVEVTDAIAYNAAIMQKVGLNVCINSDDAEMARRLNQEAGKVVRYGGISEEEAWKMVTINPAKALHVDNQTGSIKVGKDADVVLWNTHPMSIYAFAEQTYVDGALFFDRNKDVEKRKEIAAERKRLINKLLAEKKGGAPTVPGTPSFQFILSCGDHAHKHGLYTIDIQEGEIENDEITQ